MKVENGVLIDVKPCDLVNGTFSSWEGIKEIGEFAFRKCTSLKKIKIPSTIERVGKYAFSYTGLEEVVMPEGDIILENGVFENCRLLTKAKILANIKSLPKSTFKYCESLTKVILPNSLLNIGKNCFRGCESLENIKLPKDLLSIDDGAFCMCKNLKKIKIPEKVTSISYETFAGCNNLKKAKFSPNTKTIGYEAFFQCRKLVVKKLPDTIEEIKERAFLDCIRIGGILGTFEIYGTVKLPKNLKIIGNEAFDNCTNLTHIELPENVEVIGDSAFKNCDILKNVQLSPNLKIIGNQAFAQTFNLYEIKIPKSVELIGENVFRGGSLNKIEIEGNIEHVSPSSFNSAKVEKEVIKNGKVIETKGLLNNFLPGFNRDYEVVALIAKCDEDTNFKTNVKFPISFLLLLDNEELKEVLKHDNHKYLKNFNRLLDNTYAYSAYDYNDIYKFAYVLGCFSSDTVKIHGKEVKLCQKASVFLEEIMKWYMSFRSPHDMFDNLELKKYNLDFLNFIMQKNGDNEYGNFDYIKGKDREMSRIINEFDQIMQQVVVDNQGRVIQNPSYIKRIETYLKLNNFGKVEKGNEDLVDEFSKFHSIGKRHFIEAQAIRKKGKNAPNHILNEELKEETIIDSIEKIKKEIGDKTLESKKLIDELIDKEFTYEWLDKHDPKNFVLGLYCDCCASIVSEAYGEKIMEASVIRDDVQNLVIKDSKGKIIAKATIYVNKEKGYAVFNDIEMNRKYGNEVRENDYSDNKQRIKIYKAFKRGVKAFVEKYNEINDDKPITQVNVGWGYNRLKQVIEKFEEKSPYRLEVLDSFLDARDEQWVIYQR